MTRVFAALVGGWLLVIPFSAAEAGKCPRERCPASVTTDPVDTPVPRKSPAGSRVEPHRDDRPRAYFVGRTVLHLSPWEAERERRCLIVAAYAEARGSSPTGMLAVMWTILNRVAHEDFPDTPCGVVAQKGAFEGVRKAAFRSHWRAIRSGRMPPALSPKPGPDREALDRIEGFSHQLMHGENGDDPVDGATYFYAPGPQRNLGRSAPSWSRKFVRTARIAEHVFYRKTEDVALK